jgi:hypothetical protein
MMTGVVNASRAPDWNKRSMAKARAWGVESSTVHSRTATSPCAPAVRPRSTSESPRIIRSMLGDSPRSRSSAPYPTKRGRTDGSGPHASARVVRMAAPVGVSRFASMSPPVTGTPRTSKAVAGAGAG